MNNLHRELAPISSSAWEQIEEEVARTFKRSVAGRRVVDVDGPEGPELSAVGTGHLVDVAAPRELVNARLREVRTIVELTVPFELSRDAIDSVERGARDADWQPAKDAAQRLAFAEDGAIFDGYPAAGIVGIREGTSNRKLTLPADVSAYPDAISDALEALRLAGVDGPRDRVRIRHRWLAADHQRRSGWLREESNEWLMLARPRRIASTSDPLIVN